MSKIIDFSKPLSLEDKKWLHERSLDYQIEGNERQFKQADVHAAGQPVKVDYVALLPKAVVESDVEDINIDDLTVDELKDELKDFNASTNGNKHELAARLKKCVADAEKG